MAIAPLAEPLPVDVGATPASVCDLLDMPWPRPVLRVVVPGGDGIDGVDEDVAEEEWETARRVHDAAARRHRRARVRTLRRRLLMVASAAAVIAGLALPLHALGRSPVPAASRTTVVPGGAVYVVQPGDTLWSIAGRLDGGGDVRPLAEELARETGSTTVVPGERIAIP